MALKAGFAEVDITPDRSQARGARGTHKIGWLKTTVADKVLDPLFARVAVFEAARTRVGIAQLDTLCVRWTTVADIRKRVRKACGLPGRSLLVAATHNHAGPAVARVGDVPRDDAYVETLVQKVVAAFEQATAAAQEAEVGFASTFEFDVAHNRRVLMRDGTVRTHGRFDDPLALCFEGPIDPEVAVIAARTRGGEPLGAIVNFACHPTHHGGDGAISAGFPGDLAREMRSRGWPITLYLNGASGNLHTSDPAHGGADKSKEQVGAILADAAIELIRS